MNLSEFLLADAAEKKWTVLHQGILMAKRSHAEYMVFLFQMDGYYVETYCNLEDKAIEEYRVSLNPQTLTPYLSAIHIDDLF